MTCNCNNMQNNDSTIQFVRGTTVNLVFNFNVDISSYTNAIFTIKENYGAAPVLTKNVAILTQKVLPVTLSKEETENFNEFPIGKNSSKYIWGLDLVDSENNIQINIFPQTGSPAPLCIVYKHIIGEA